MDFTGTSTKNYQIGDSFNGFMNNAVSSNRNGICSNRSTNWPSHVSFTARSSSAGSSSNSDWAGGHGSHLYGHGNDNSGYGSRMDGHHGPWVDPIQDSMRRRSQALARADQGRVQMLNKASLEANFNSEPEPVYANPYAEYGRQLARNSHRDDFHNHNDDTNHRDSGFGCFSGGSFRSSHHGHGMEDGRHQYAYGGRDHARDRGGRNSHHFCGPSDRQVHVNPYKSHSQPSRIQHIGNSFSHAQPPKPSERLVVPRQELEMLSRFGETGGAPGQLDSPHGFCLGSQGEIIVADTMNNRIQIFDQKGTLIISWGTGGYRKGRLWQPRKVAYIDGLDRVVVSDRGRDCSRLQIFSRNGDFFSQIRTIRSTLFVGLTVYRGLVIAIENQPSSCIIMSQEGKVLYQFSLEKVMEEPSDVLVVNEVLYICDFLGHCVCVFDSMGKLVRRIGDNFPGIIFFPNGIDVAESGDVIVADTHGNRFHISVWSPEGKLLADYELPHMKVSRCCGLFMTPEGNLITAATNNNIVLITNLLRVATPDATSTVEPLNQWPITLPECADEESEIPFSMF